ncbi:hypothetical protein, partial [Klebsiella pneumoniae]|uniref:hypothetical protein n=1 Tax=Klebsiella pneumoniae TaxID=573 RepID=UPI003719ACED
SCNAIAHGETSRFFVRMIVQLARRTSLIWVKRRGCARALHRSRHASLYWEKRNISRSVNLTAPDPATPDLTTPRTRP